MHRETGIETFCDLIYNMEHIHEIIKSVNKTKHTWETVYIYVHVSTNDSFLRNEEKQSKNPYNVHGL